MPAKFPYCSRWISLVVLTGCISSVQAQTGDTLSYVQEIPEITVIAAGAAPALRSAVPLQVLQQSDMARYGVVDISDALRRFSGVNVKDYGGVGGLKTVSVRSFGAQHTAVAYDGVPVTDAQNGQIDLSRFSLDQIEQLTLAIGETEDIFVSAKMFASPALLKIGSSIPEFGKQDYHLTAQLKAGSFGMVNPYLRYSRKLSDRITLSLYGDYTHADGKFPFTLTNGNLVTREKRSNTASDSYRTEMNLYTTPGLNSTLNYKFYYYDSDRQLPGAVILYNPYNKEKLREQNLFTQLLYKTRLNSSWSMQFTTKYNWAASRYSDKSVNYAGGIYRQNYFQREYYASAVLLFRPLRPLSFSYAADYSYNDLTSDIDNFCYPERHTILQALAANYTTTRFTATGTLLGSFYRNRVRTGEHPGHPSRISPSLSVMYRPFPEKGLRLRVSYKDIFRMPTFNENYFDRSGSRHLKPERVKQFNAGISYETGAAGRPYYFSVTVDGYYNTIQDKIVSMPRMFIWSVINMGEVKTAGVDLNLNTRIVPTAGYSCSISGNYTYQHAVDRTTPKESYYGHQIPYTPPHSGAIAFGFETPYLNLAYTLTGSAERYYLPQNSPANRIGSYTEHGISLHRSFTVKKTTLLVRGDLINLSDKQYEIVHSFPMPGRTYKFTINFNI